MTPKKHYAGPIPVAADGTVHSYPWHNDTWKENYEFDAVLTLTSSLRGRSAARFLFEDTSGRRYEMFMTDMVDMIQRAKIIAYGNVEGRWTFCKRGQNYGLQLVE